MGRFNYILLLIAFIFVGCFKKFEEVDTLNTNIFDRDYIGEKWFVIEETLLYTNEIGQNKARAKVVIPEEYVPELKPSNISLELKGKSIDTKLIDFPQAINGDYEGFIDLPYVGVDSIYCFELGIYVVEENSAINSFEECYSIEP